MNHGELPRKKTASPWLHVGFYWCLLIGSIALAGTVILMSTAQLRNLPPDELWSVFTLGVVLLGVPGVVWPRFLFLKRDLRDLVRRQGGRVLSERRRALDARLGSLRMLARVDRPILDYWPSPRLDVLRSIRTRSAVRIGGYHPRYMHSMSRIDLIWFADLTSLRETDILVRVAGAQKIIDRATGVDAVDGALAETEGVESSDPVIGCRSVVRRK